MPPSDITADHALVRDVLPHLPAQVRLDLNLPQAVCGRRDLLLRERMCQRGRDVAGCGERVCGDRRGVCGGREEGSEGGHLGLVQIAHSAAVVDLHTRAEAEGSRLPNTVEVCQGMLFVRH